MFVLTGSIELHHLCDHLCNQKMFDVLWMMLFHSIQLFAAMCKYLNQFLTVSVYTTMLFIV